MFQVWHPLPVVLVVLMRCFEASSASLARTVQGELLTAFRLLKATPSGAGEAERSMEPVTFPVAAITCSTSAETTPASKCESAPAWKHDDQVKALEALEVPEDMDTDTQLKFEKLFSQHEQTFTSSDLDLGYDTGLQRH